MKRGYWCLMREVKSRLFDIARVLAEIEDAISGLSVELYDQAINVPESINWRLMIAGEAANHIVRIQPELLDMFPEFERLIAVRNRIVHGNFSVDNYQVWAIATEHLPGLAKRLRQYLESLP